MYSMIWSIFIQKGMTSRLLSSALYILNKCRASIYFFRIKYVFFKTNNRTRKLTSKLCLRLTYQTWSQQQLLHRQQRIITTRSTGLRVYGSTVVLLGSRGETFLEMKIQIYYPSDRPPFYLPGDTIRGIYMYRY